MKNIRILAIMMSLCLLLTMAACGNKKDESQGSQESSTQAPTTEAPTTEAPTTETPTTETPTTDGGNEEPAPTLKYSWATQGGDGTEASPLIINQTNFLDFYEYYKVGSFEAFSTEVEYFKLGSDIVVNEGNAEDWATTAPAKVFGAPLSDFYGVLDGDGHSISGIYMKTNNTYRRAALIGQLWGTVKNLSILNSYFEIDSTGYDEAAAIAGRMCTGTIENCFSDAILRATQTNGTNLSLGGMAGMIAGQNAKISNCVFAGDIDAGAGYAGGIVAKINGQLNMILSNCLNLGTVKGGALVGAIIGRDEAGGGSTSSMTGCVNLSKEIYKEGLPAIFVYGGGLSKYGINDLYVINEFASVSDATAGNTRGENLDGIANVYHTHNQLLDATKVHRMSLADFLALGGTANAPEGWYFKDGYVPVPIQGLEIPLAGYLTAWGITLS